MGRLGRGTPCIDRETTRMTCCSIDSMESIITFTTTARRRNGWRGIGDTDAAARDGGAGRGRADGRGDERRGVR